MCIYIYICALSLSLSIYIYVLSFSLSLSLSTHNQLPVRAHMACGDLETCEPAGRSNTLLRTTQEPLWHLGAKWRNMHAAALAMLECARADASGTRAHTRMRERNTAAHTHAHTLIRISHAYTTFTTH